MSLGLDGAPPLSEFLAERDAIKRSMARRDAAEIFFRAGFRLEPRPPPVPGGDLYEVSDIEAYLAGTDARRDYPSSDPYPWDEDHESQKYLFERGFSD